MAEAKYKKSKSGYYRVQLNAVWPHEGFDYKPSHTVTFDEATLEIALAAGVVGTIIAAD
jgi:hypothetical protein